MNKIHLERFKYTYTEKLKDDVYLVRTIAIKQKELTNQGIRFNPITSPTGVLIIDGKEFPLRNAGLTTMKIPGGGTLIIGSSYHFGHWYYRNTLNIIFDNFDEIDYNESKNVRIF